MKAAAGVRGSVSLGVSGGEVTGREGEALSEGESGWLALCVLDRLRDKGLTGA